MIDIVVGEKQDFFRCQEKNVLLIVLMTHSIFTPNELHILSHTSLILFYHELYSKSYTKEIHKFLIKIKFALLEATIPVLMYVYFWIWSQSHISCITAPHSHNDHYILLMVTENEGNIIMHQKKEHLSSLQIRIKAVKYHTYFSTSVYIFAWTLRQWWYNMLTMSM